MAILSPLGQERLFVLGLGVTTCAIIGLMRRMLVHYRDTAALPPTENKSHYIDQDTEDSLKLSTLDKLLDNPNYGIQETAAIIICERALHDKNTLDILLWYITRPDHDTREKGIRALTMIMNSSTAGLVHKPKTYSALVKSLEYSLTDYEHNPYDPEWDNWHLRDVAEQGCLIILGQLVHKFDVEELINAGFVERWLVKEPWGGEGDEGRQGKFMDSLSKENRLNQILLRLFRHKGGRRRLEEAKLLPPRPALEKEQMTTDGVDDAAMEDFEGMFVESRRPRDQSMAEEHLRRRHREAMVLNDGTRPLGRDDIIQRER
ncbi:cytoskeleton-associated protein [Rutstroemia sp. NJR-2017a BBW]|nr:cytoskeleton-associated protein [Rutstroemia sp. NJR-2017a BBW]